MLNLSVFSHNHYPSGVKMLAKKSNVEFRYKAVISKSKPHGKTGVSPGRKMGLPRCTWPNCSHDWVLRPLDCKQTKIMCSAKVKMDKGISASQKFGWWLLESNEGR